MKTLDLTGQKLGKLLVLERKEKNKWQNYTFLCRCDCGNLSIVSSGNLKRGNSTSCGCANKGNTGKHWKLSKEFVEKNRKRMIGNKINLGRIISKTTKEKMSNAHKLNYQNGRVSVFKGKPSWNKGKVGFPAWNKGLKGFMAGEDSPHWIIDRNQLQRYNDDAKDRRSYIYNNWRKQVWTRDNYKCKISNADCVGRIFAHHILGYTEYPELRYDINNGITLCHAHHPRKRAEEKRLSPYFMDLVSVSKE